jgi:peptidoglycan/LPS O-acetylase OafA/YrhL
MSDVITPAHVDDISETTRAKSEPRIHLEFLDGLRGIAALYVVLFHFISLKMTGIPRLGRLVFSWTHYGHLAVDVFIVLSGFCLMLPVARSADHRLRGSIQEYLRRRAWRILPPYYAALVFSLLGFIAASQVLRHYTGAGSPEWQSTLMAGDMISHFTLVQNFNPHWSGTINMAMWSVATEWQIYFVFPLLLLPVWRRFGISASIAAGLVVGLLPQILMPHSEYINCACPWYCGLFALGMAGAVATASGKLESDARAKYLLWLIVPIAVAYVGLKHFQPSEITARLINMEWLKDVMGGAVAICVVLHCVRAATDRSQPRRSMLLRILQSRWAVRLGTFSYSLYLVHCIVLRGCNTVAQVLHMSPLHDLAFSALVGIPVAVLVAYLFHLVFERPFMSGFRKQTEAREWLRSKTWGFRGSEQRSS